MNKTIPFLLLLLGFFPAVSGLCQTSKTRLQPGRLYASGEEIYAPTFGFTSKVPDGWVGALPRETEVFLLNANSGFFGEMYVFGREQTDLNRLAEDWKKGVKVTETLTLMAVNPRVEGSLLFGDVQATGNFVNKNYRGFAATRCGDKGYCITVLAVSLEENTSLVKSAAFEFLNSGTFDSPRIIDPFEDFDWKAFLSNKLMVSYDQILGGQKQSEVNLCGDGSFNASVRKKGLLKDTNPEYKGRMSGTWRVEGAGSQAVLTLEFSKKNLSPLTVNLIFVEEQLMVGNERYYASESQECR
ncbi:hypothetical protein C943_02332 [Mariniradius saccharolyticus AK6]|uniref:Uncharacterized protein n=1 Tax=Mariniradius saccharolyticus AK6 TaxID=1239962 RepID=M7X0X8_9BACT|nr:hypothetical protein [Mariniradius saccharolyticus]EMS31185.1 hypothetical protein C943_02332 [Mariniradius saccharolyticus AK6]